jgi:nitroreductase
VRDILTRRSIRKYTGQTVTDEQVTELLRAAMSAPSAANQQPWRFVVIRSQEQRELIPRFHPHASMAPNAAVVVAVCGDLRELPLPERWVQDCSAATQNLLLAAHDMGLGAVWLGVYPTEERVEGVRKLLALPDYIVPLSMVAIGYPAEHPPVADRFDAGYVHYERW